MPILGIFASAAKTTIVNTYEAIASTTVGSGGASTIDFTSIPQTYTDLLIKVSVRATYSTTTLGMFIKFNDSTTSVNSIELGGYGSGVYSSSDNTKIMAGVADAANLTSLVYGSNDIYIPNYTSSNNKSVSTDGVSEGNTALTYCVLDAGLWSNTSAITKITLYPYSGNLVQYSTATLYGIKNS